VTDEAEEPLGGEDDDAQPQTAGGRRKGLGSRKAGAGGVQAQGTGTGSGDAGKKGSGAWKAGVGGVVGGAGVSTVLFTSLPLGKILLGEANFPAGYPIMVFGLISVFALIAALVARQVTRTQLWIGVLGIAVFVGVVLLGHYETANRPTIAVIEQFEPSPANFTDPDTIAPVQLKMVYDLPGVSGTESSGPLSDKFIKVQDSQTVKLTMLGFEDLTGKYQKAYERLGVLKEEIHLACTQGPDAPVCKMLDSAQGGAQ
jgi:hypothetical protein